MEGQGIPAALAAHCLPSRIARKALHAESLVDAGPQCSVEERLGAQLHVAKQAWSFKFLLHGFTWHDRMRIPVAGRQRFGLGLFIRPRAKIQSYLQIWAPYEYLIVIAQSFHSRSMSPILDN